MKRHDFLFHRRIGALSRLEHQLATSTDLPPEQIERINREIAVLRERTQ